MWNYNRTVLMGRLSREPGKTTKYAYFTVATNRTFKDGTGLEKEEATFVDCRAYGKMGDTIYKNFKKGRPIFIEGTLRSTKWKNKEGKNMENLIVVLDSFEFVDYPKDGNMSKKVNNDEYNGSKNSSDNDYYNGSDDFISDNNDEEEGFDEVVQKALGND